MTHYPKTDRTMPARQCPIAENEPIEIAKFWKSGRDRKNSIVVAIKSYEGHVFLDCRLYGTNAEGQTVPSAKGVTVGTLRMTEFLRAVQKAHAKFKELGLLADDEAAQ
jgi:hypothetical protein